MLSSQQVEDLNRQAQQQQPKEILATALDLVPNLTIAFSGAEDIAMVAMAKRIAPEISVFTLDTGRLHAETYRFIEEVRKRLELNLTVLSPNQDRLTAFVREKGLFSFYEEGHESCCEIRKVEPLRAYLQHKDGWATGQRRDQSPARAIVPVFEIDGANRGKNGALLKVNPLANWSLQQVWDYIRMMELPYNPLHDRGFISIGCEPCTRAVSPGQHEREGRWWWEEATIKECGLHRSNLAKSGEESFGHE